MIPLLGGALCFMAAWLLTEAWRRNALSRRIVDIPNERSSHSTPTPRGGGIAIVVSFSIFLILFHTLGWIDRNLTLAILGGGLLVASVGFFDDHGHVAPRWRLLAHAAAASWALWHLGGIPPLRAGSFVWNWSWVGNLIGAIGIIWSINLTNFMDGIDGLAGAETIFVATSSGLLARIDRMGSPAFSCYLLAAATLGFLVHNWPPARIFMGDAGSGFLGFVLAVLMLADGPGAIVPGLILFAVFITDSTVTLLRRFFRKARWFEAHRSHAYQHAARRWGHLPITVSILAIDVFWLAPLAYVARRNTNYTVLAALFAFIPLIIGVVYFRAGTENE